MPKTKQLSYKVASTLPPRPPIKTEWDLENLYYKNLDDPKLESDVVATERLYKRFAKKWHGVDFTESVSTLATVLSEYEALAANPVTSRAMRYLHLRLALNTADTPAEKLAAKLTQRLRPLSDRLLFFKLTLGSVPKTKQRLFLKAQELLPYRYFLERTFLEASYHLSEAEEKIINLKSQQSYGRWVDMVEKIISNREVLHNKKRVAIPEALELLDTLPSNESKKLWQAILAETKQIGEVAEHEFNAIITDVRTEESLRGYKKPYSSTAVGYEDTESSIENLVAVISDTGFALSKKFYKLKAEFHGVDALHYTQKYDSIGTPITLSFDQAVDICRDVFYKTKTEYGAIFDSMLSNGQIDVYPKKGKRGGAFMSNSVGHPTQVFLNHTNTTKALETLAHEMGHAIHSERSKTQSALYEGHTIPTAETASTLFENILFDALYEQSPEESQIVLLHDRLTRDIATMQRQIAFFNCELEIHTEIMKSGGMTNEELRACMEKHLKSYLGKGVSVTPDDGYSYVYIPHLRYGFYVYTYCFGHLMSSLMAKNLKSDPRYIDKIDTFLCAGESDTVANIFKKIGINTRKPAVFETALTQHAEHIKTFEQFVKKKRKK